MNLLNKSLKLTLLLFFTSIAASVFPRTVYYSSNYFSQQKHPPLPGNDKDNINRFLLQVNEPPECSLTSIVGKEPADIYALADEYLSLAFHGLRAKDKFFNATLNTEFDETIGKINIVHQDIGRVILNLIANALYACAERSRSTVDEKKKQNPESYESTVSVSAIHSLSSGKGRGEVLISIKDNGPGIPQKVLDKIFQPFFTTKPTGQGTGLGLSLAYDIVKAHGGELKVETKEEEGSEFIIRVPH
jgi:signal transduction histidine kinase